MQAFCVQLAKCEGGQPSIEQAQVFWDRQASYRHYMDAGGDPIPRKHRIESLATRTPGQLVCWHVVDIPDRKKYDGDLIQEIVQKILNGEISQSEASRLYGPSQSRISEWVRTHVATQV